MQNIEKYQIIDESNLNIHKINSNLCVLSFKTKFDIAKIRDLIRVNPQVQFWLSSPNLGRDDIICANEIGIKNILPYPFDEKIITKYLEGLSISNQKSDENSIQSTIFKDMKIMIVDDNVMNIELLEEVLRGLGFHLEVYTQPLNAIEQINLKTYDLFLLDILMPEISGFDIAQVIKESKLNKNSQIMFISALSDYEYKISGYDAGACLYVEKPFDVNLLRRQICNVLKKEELKREINSSKDRHLAMITHDLKTPITAEITALQLLLKNKLGDLNELQQEILSDILSSAKFLKTLTDNILCSYKHNNSQIELYKEECDLISLIKEVISETKYLLKDKEISLKFETKLSCAITNVDIIEIKRVINNLIGNAYDYAPIGSEIILSLVKISKEFYISVSDSGCGINLKNPNDIFDCNLTLAKENKRIGFGLGLFISKNIVENHNGRIFVESEVNKGTTITFTLPI